MYSVEFLFNGLVRVRSRVNGLVGLYAQNGDYRSGDLRLTPETVLALLS